MWLLRPAFQPAVATAHISALVILVLCYGGAWLGREPLRQFLAWLIVASTVASCLTIVVANDPTAQVRVLYGRQYGPGMAFWIYAAIGAAVGLTAVVSSKAFATGKKSPSARGDLLGRTDVRVASLLIFNGGFVALPFLLAMRIQLEVRTTDGKPLVGTFHFKSDLTGRNDTMIANHDGLISLRLLWNDMIEGRVQAPGFAPVQLDILHYRVDRLWYLPLPPPINGVHEEQTFPVKPIRANDLVPVNLLGFGRIQAAMYDELCDKIGQLKRGYDHGRPLQSNGLLPQAPQAFLEDYLQSDALIAEAKDPRSPISWEVRATLKSLGAENTRLRTLCDSLCDQLSGQARDQGLADLCQILIGSPSSELSWTEKRAVIYRQLDHNGRLFNESALN